MINRQASSKLLEMAKKFPIIAITGPRQSGKTTLAKMVFTSYAYVSLENLDNLQFAEDDPKGFLKTYNQFVIIDEVQKAPKLFSYLQTIVDNDNIEGQYILSGSQNFLLLEKITQSLAGRVYLMELLPLSQFEIKNFTKLSCFEAIVKGSYPRIYDKQIASLDFYPNYIKTYIERDVRTIINVQDLATFKKFVTILSHYVGQLFNANKISKELRIAVKTVQNWLSILQTSYIIFLLPTWHQNFAKRLTKTPKLYFYDTGLVSYLLGLENDKEMVLSNYKGALFENFSILEILKNYKNTGRSANFYFWRDSNGNEIDLVIERGQKIKLIEMKSSETIKKEFLKSLHYLDDRNTALEFKHYLINTSEEAQIRSKESIIPWKEAASI